MSWRFILKNSGSVPAKVRIDKNQITVTTDGRSTRFPTLGDRTWQTILMPGVEAEAAGHLSDSDDAKVQDILGGRTTLEIDLALSYEASGALWWTTKYQYAVKQLFRQSLRPPGFITVSGDAD